MVDDDPDLRHLATTPKKRESLHAGSHEKTGGKTNDDF